MLNPLSLKENSQGPFIRKSVLLVLICFFTIHLAIGADRDYSYAIIPKSLLENAKAVIRYHETTFDIQSSSKAVLRVSYAMTIVNESGIENGCLRQFYDKFSHINSIKGTVYNSSGEKVERIERDKILDVSAISGFSTYEDHRMIYIQPQYRTVPFTVEYSFDVVYDGILDYPDYYLLNDYNIALEQASLFVTSPDSVGIRYLERNIITTCKSEQTKSGTKYSWTFNNIQPIRYEPFSPPITENIPSVLLAPNFFKLKKLSGNAESWESFGLWVYELTEGRGELNSETKNKVLNIVSETGDIMEKIGGLYKYLQDKTRYASIQIGLGGWQPSEANEVDRLSYGDCKALTNYMQALLKAANISSYYTLVSAGEFSSDIISGFPSNQFNHAILCVPLNEDTLWVECTSQHLPLGYLGSFTDDRTVLIIKENGGFLGHTKTYSRKDNIQSRVSRINLSKDGSGKFAVSTTYKGIYYDDLLPVILSDETDKRKKIENGIQTGNFKLEYFELKEHKSLIPMVEETLNLTVQNIFVMAGDLMLFTPNQLNKQELLPFQINKRKNPIRIRRSICEIDTAYYSLPEGFTLNSQNLDESITSEFGEYRAASSIEGLNIRYVRKMTINKGYYPSDSYGNFIDFFEKVSYADNKKLALKTVK